MIGYYKLPAARLVSKQQNLRIADESELKDAIYDKSLQKAEVLSFKNSNIRQESLRLLQNVTVRLSIKQIDLSQNFSFITDTAVEILCGLGNLGELKILNLADNQITDDSLVYLAKCNSMMKLQQLILYGNSDISDEGIVILSSSPFIHHLKRLDVHATSVQDQGISQFIKNQNSSNLQNLNLSMSWQRITNKTMYNLAKSQFCNKLKILNLEDCRVSDIGLDELSESENSSTIQHLNLNNSIKSKNNTITDKGLSNIAFSKYLTNLKNLQLRNTDITAKGLKTLAVSAASQKIETLRLSHCQKLQNQALTYLQQIINYQSLKKLYLNETSIGRKQLQAFDTKNPQVNIVY